MRVFVRILALAFMALPLGAPALAGTRVKDIVDVEGVRENQLMGYGLVTGLNGTGDGLRNCTMTRQSMEAMLERLGVNTRTANLNTKNTAAVTVTANLPPFGTNGSRIDVTIAAMCDAKSLEGGQLIVTPLMGADGEVYAVAQGAVAVGGFSAAGQSGSSLTRNVPTTGRIPNGATLEREMPFDLAGRSEIKLALRNPDFTTATRIAGAINAYVGSSAATAIDPATVKLVRPTSVKDMSALIAQVELLQVEPDQPARIVINEVTGVIVMGDNVRISPVVVAQGNLTVQVQETPGVSQPNSFGQGQTQVVPQSNVKVSEDTAHLALIGGNGVPLRELVNGLNALGVSPRDLIAILQAVKRNGALQAEIELM